MHVNKVINLTNYLLDWAHTQAQDQKDNPIG